MIFSIRQPAYSGRAIALAALLGCTALAGCGSADLPLESLTQTYNRGYVLDENALQQVPVGSSQEQVLLVLGTPSTVATVSGEAFYYISQKAKRTAFLKPEVVDQRVLAVYFSPDRRVTRIANYGLQDGKIFDFVSRTTVAGGADISLVGNILKNVTNINPFGG
ncbi:MAG: outer membrane protein assembly factor BamE [Xanthobacteraceae bacterium]|nr:outer membrane protein assembly factor BamE [Xanthobacteraceae bacterium]